MLRIVALVSGAGTNLRALLDRAEHADFPARIVAIGADRDCAALRLGEQYGIPTFEVSFSAFATREEWGRAFADEIALFSPDLVLSSGLMRIVPESFVERFSPAFINTHPSYLPAFPGAHAVRDALEAGAAETGASIFIVDRGVDTGALIAQERVTITPTDTEDSLHERIKQTERRMLIDVVEGIATGRINLETIAREATTASEEHTE